VYTCMAEVVSAFWEIYRTFEYILTYRAYKQRGRRLSADIEGLGSRGSTRFLVEYTTWIPSGTAGVRIHNLNNTNIVQHKLINK
jgi:hypothetical protein